MDVINNTLKITTPTKGIKSMYTLQVKTTIIFLFLFSCLFLEVKFLRIFEVESSKEYFEKPRDMTVPIGNVLKLNTREIRVQRCSKLVLYRKLFIG